MRFAVPHGIVPVLCPPLRVFVFFVVPFLLFAPSGRIHAPQRLSRDVPGLYPTLRPRRIPLTRAA